MERLAGALRMLRRQLPLLAPLLDCSPSGQRDDESRLYLQALAHRLGLDVVAEGIETAEQFEALRELACPSIQGYWTGRPMSMAAINTLLTADKLLLRQDFEEIL